MIDYAKTEVGDILEITGQGAPGFAANGELVRVLFKSVKGVTVENKDGHSAEFVFNCGAARLNPTSWKNDFSECPPKKSVLDGVPVDNSEWKFHHTGNGAPSSKEEGLKAQEK